MCWKIIGATPAQISSHKPIRTLHPNKFPPSHISATIDRAPLLSARTTPFGPSTVMMDEGRERKGKGSMHIPYYRTQKQGRKEGRKEEEALNRHRNKTRRKCNNHDVFVCECRSFFRTNNFPPSLYTGD